MEIKVFPGKKSRAQCTFRCTDFCHFHPKRRKCSSRKRGPSWNMFFSLMENCYLFCLFQFLHVYFLGGGGMGSCECDSILLCDVVVKFFLKALGQTVFFPIHPIFVLPNSVQSEWIGINHKVKTRIDWVLAPTFRLWIMEKFISKLTPWKCQLIEFVSSCLWLRYKFNYKLCMCEHDSTRGHVTHPLRDRMNRPRRPGEGINFQSSFHFHACNSIDGFIARFDEQISTSIHRNCMHENTFNYRLFAYQIGKYESAPP